jgi:two-component system chemotaxis response regulator CheY
MAFNILIVDDSPAMRRVVRRVVDLSGFEVGKYLEAGDGRQALSVLRSEWVDLIVTDINMPEMDGEQLLIAVRQDAMLSEIPVLVVSTDQSASRIEDMMAHGANGYVSKPFMPAALSEQMYKLLGGVPDAGF